ncbi:MAG: hypothetical protein JWQ81_6277 [Amycolatopsis sp.]|nr:hypothetical protein [Amycolatopsis sp.]
MAEKRTPPPEFWRRVPVDPGYRDWLTVGFDRQVLVVIRTVTTATRLLDVLSLFEHDRRIQVVFTHDDENRAVFSPGIDTFLRRLDASVITWPQAVATRFDLAIAASENDRLHELDAPVLLLPHGIGYQKFYPAGQVVSGMNPNQLLRHGQVVPDAIALSHPVQRDQLRAACPEALGHAVVVGDPCHDRMLVSRHLTPRYRAALATGNRTLVVLCSTWGPGSLYGSRPELPDRLLAELPLDEYQVAVILHPGVWSAHSAWQLQAWLGAPAKTGLAVIPPEQGWQATILAADLVISDEGSAALYAAAVDKPLLMAAGDTATTVTDSPLAALAARTARLDHDGDLAAQLDIARRAHRPGDHEPVVKQAVDSPGRSAELLSRHIYDRLALPLPTVKPSFPPVASPVTEPADITAFLVSAQALDDTVSVSRFPLIPRLPEPPVRPFQHVVAHAEAAELRELDAAAVVYTDLGPDTLGDLLDHWPTARLAASVENGTCHVLPRGGSAVRLSAAGVDPLALASLAYFRLARHEEIVGAQRIQLGKRTAEVIAG